MRGCATIAAVVGSADRAPDPPEPASVNTAFEVFGERHVEEGVEIVARAELGAQLGNAEPHPLRMVIGTRDLDVPPAEDDVAARGVGPLRAHLVAHGRSCAGVRARSAGGSVSESRNAGISSNRNVSESAKNTWSCCSRRLRIDARAGALRRLGELDAALATRRAASAAVAPG